MGAPLGAEPATGVLLAAKAPGLLGGWADSLGGGAVPVATLPPLSTATQSDEDGQDTPRSTWVPSTLATVHFPATPVGSVEVTTLPAPSTAAQREDDGQDTPRRVLFPSTCMGCDQAVTPPAGSVEVRRCP